MSLLFLAKVDSSSFLGISLVAFCPWGPLKGTWCTSFPLKSHILLSCWESRVVQKKRQLWSPNRSIFKSQLHWQVIPGLLDVSRLGNSITYRRRSGQTVLGVNGIMYIKFLHTVSCQQTVVLFLPIQSGMNYILPSVDSEIHEGDWSSWLNRSSSRQGTTSNIYFPLLNKKTSQKRFLND